MDMVNVARAMMLATGCIQALQCHRNTCPTGVATQDERLIKGLDVEDKSHRVFNFHDATIKSFTELLAASGVHSADELSREHIFRRVGATKVMKYSDIYPEVEIGVPEERRACTAKYPRNDLLTQFGANALVSVKRAWYWRFL